MNVGISPQLLQQLSNLVASNQSPAAAMPVGEALTKYYDEKKLRKTTRDNYTDAAKSVLSGLFGKKLGELTREEIVGAFRDARSPSMANVAIAVLRATYRYFEVPAPMIRFPNNKIRPRDTLVERESLPIFWSVARRFKFHQQLALTLLLG